MKKVGGRREVCRYVVIGVTALSLVSWCHLPEGCKHFLNIPRTSQPRSETADARMGAAQSIRRSGVEVEVTRQMSTAGWRAVRNAESQQRRDDL